MLIKLIKILNILKKLVNQRNIFSNNKIFIMNLQNKQDFYKNFQKKNPKQ